MQSRKNSKSIEQFSDVCSICLEDFNTEKKISKLTPCSHIFCQLCLENWLTIKKTCPQCCQLIQEINVLKNNQVIAQQKIEKDSDDEEAKSQDSNEIGKEFFKEQFQNQLNRIKHIKNKLSQDYKSNQELKWMFIFQIEDEVQINLTEVNHQNEANYQQVFNKKALIENIFRIEEILNKLELNNWSFIDFSVFQQEQEQSNVYYPSPSSKQYKNFFQDNDDFFNNNEDFDEIDDDNDKEIKSITIIELKSDIEFINNFPVIKKKANNNKSKKQKKQKKQKKLLEQDL